MFGQWMGEDKIIIKKRRNNMIKSFKGNSLTELDKEVNEYLKENPLARVIDFSASSSGSSVSKMIYIYIVEIQGLK